MFDVGIVDRDPDHLVETNRVTAGLVAAGMPNDVVVPSVFLYRLGTLDPDRAGCRAGTRESIQSIAARSN